jgi:cbb3-type cytochrome oxidase subunit 3
VLQELSENTDAAFYAIASTLFFFIVFLAVTVRVLTRRRGSYDAAARLPLEDDASAGHAEAQPEKPTSAGH